MVIVNAFICIREVALCIKNQKKMEVTVVIRRDRPELFLQILFVLNCII